ncbi:MAG: N-6 DNA methylase [Ignavibacteria bacterium]|nr:N-6 DNA methylase [Ignavibacteria bacterium]
MQDKDSAYKEIASLIERFEEQIISYKRSEYNETLTRRDFIDPFFNALGWDIDNKQGYAEAYREVIHEDKVRIGSSTKAPDYSFRLPGGKRLFFVEAKKPSVVVKEEILPAYQVRRYGWSAKLPISIITDFEEFSVYDCTKKPFPTDKASVSRIKYLTFRDYLNEFDFLWDTFSKEKVLKGSFDKFVAGTADKKGTAAVDEDFLLSLDKWRSLLAVSISKLNKDLDEDELNFAVQQTIDRLIFLRIAEDRNIEPYGNLAFAVRQGEYFQNLYQIFKDADEKYNSGLFDLKKDQISKNLLIDKKVIKSIVEQLYYPECPYEFSVLSVEILGSAYEQFLGRQIKIGKFNKAVIEEKPEVRKAGGVYYTPQYIVDYIVENTVGKLIQDKTVDFVSKIKVLDPACGSGSFLIGAYQYLLDWHKNYYGANTRSFKGGKNSPVTPEGNLTTSEKKRILLNNIFGVDIDVNAVEVTKLSLLLKCLEGETEASIKNQLSLFNERVLPTLDNNIKSGNSLIDTDFYDSQIDFGHERKIKPFNWQKAFPQVFNSNGGFDVVIGNPPYVKIQTILESNPGEIVEYFKTRYASASKGNYDLYVVFTERAFSLLNKEGVLGYILPHKFFQSEFGAGLRDHISKENAIERIVHFGAEQIFKNATTYTCLLFLGKNQKKSFEFLEINKPEVWAEDHSTFNFINVNQPLPGDKWNFNTSINSAIFDKMNKIPDTLGSITRKIFVGLQTSADKIYVLDIIKEETETFTCFSKSLEREVVLEKEMVKPFLMGKDVKRYQKPKPRCVVIFPYNIIEGKAILMTKEEIKKVFPLTWEYLSENKKVLENRENGKMKGNSFYAYIYPKNLVEFDTTKIMTPYLALQPNFTFDNDNLYHTTKVFSLSFSKRSKVDPLYILGLLNSKLMDFHIRSTGTVFRGGYFTFNTQFIESFRVKLLNQDLPQEKVIHDQVVHIVKQILDLTEQVNHLKIQSQIDEMKTKISYLEEKVDRIFYDLYELTPEEIKIIETKATNSQEP